MVKITRDFIPVGRQNRPGHLMTPQYITEHNTGSTNGTAKAHASYIKTAECASRPASWHFTVDDKEIYQHLPLTENGWHAGDGGSGPGNRNSIAIEICEFTDQVRQAKTETNAAWLTAKLIREVSSLLPFPGCMKQHYDWSGKNCPSVLRGRPGGWEGFLRQVQGYLKEEGGDEDMLKTAIVVNTFADIPAVEPLAEYLDAPIFFRKATGQLRAETIIVAGGDADAFKKAGVKVINLSGADRWGTATLVGEYYRGVK